MRQSEQEIYPYRTDQIDLRKLVKSLVERKWFIFGFTGIVTLIAIIYLKNITPTYKAVSLFTSPNEISLTTLYQMQNSLIEEVKVDYIKISPVQELKELKASVFSNFLTILASKKVQFNVFNNGDYLTAFNPENAPIDDVSKFILRSIISVEISPPSPPDDDYDSIFDIELPHSVSMEGGNPQLISRYLNDLVVTANDIAVDGLKNIIIKKVNLRLDEIALEREMLLVKKRREQLNEIEELTHGAKIANSLGIIDNNFKLVSEDVVNQFTIAIGESQSLPQWYLHGEKALLERIKLLEERKNSELFIPEIISLDNEAIKLKSILLDAYNMPELNSMQLSQVATSNPVDLKKRQTVMFTFLVSFVISILLVLFMNLIKPNENNST